MIPPNQIKLEYSAAYLAPYSSQSRSFFAAIAIQLSSYFANIQCFKQFRLLHC